MDDLKKVSPKYVFNLIPQPAPRMSSSDRFKTNPQHPNPALRQRPAVTRYFGFRLALSSMANLLKFDITQTAGYFNILFILPMGESWTKSKKDRMDGTPHQQRPDRDNLLKAFQDALAVEDGFIWGGEVVKRWGKEGKIIIY